MPDSRPILNGDLQLADLPLSPLQREVILEEIFLIPPSWLFPEAPQEPRTVAELALSSGLSQAETALRLGRIIELSRDLADAVPAGAPVVILDVTQPWDVQQELPRLRQATVIVAAQGNPRKAYSAAMFLKQQGVLTVRLQP